MLNLGLPLTEFIPKVFPGEDIAYVNLDEEIIHNPYNFSMKEELEIELRFYFLVYILIFFFIKSMISNSYK